jgi:hypothetical protein
MSTVVDLTRKDVWLGCAIGCSRAVRAIFNEYRQNVENDDVIGSHVAGALAEVAVCRFLEVPVPLDMDRWHELPDIDPDIEVRWAKDGLLPIRDRDVRGDRCERRFVLVTGRPPTLTVQGWLRGTEVRPEWRRDPGSRGRPAWFVPPSALHLTSGLLVEVVR